MTLTPGSPPNPSVPFVLFRVKGGEDLILPEGKPQRLKQFQVTTFCDRAGEWELTLEDTTWHTVEEIIAKQYPDGIEVQWGYAEPGPRTGVWNGIIYDWTTELAMNCSTLHIRGGFQDSTKMAFPETSRTWPDPDKKDDPRKMKISDIVKAICDRHGIGSEIEETDDTQIFGDLDSTALTCQPFTQYSSDWRFITEVLAGHARTKKEPHLGGYFTYFSPEDNKLHFRPSTIATEEPIAKLRYLSERQGMSEIIRFCPQFQAGVWMDSNVVRLETYDVVRKETVTLVETMKDGKAGNAGPQRMDGPKDTLDICKDPASATVHQLTVAPNEGMARAQHHALWNMLYDKSFFEADLVVVGHPKYVPPKIVDIWIQAPDGTPHFYRGKFMILQATHILNLDGYITQMRIQRNATLEAGQVQAQGPIAKDAGAQGTPGSEGF
jgi:hypothetical protein